LGNLEIRWNSHDRILGLAAIPVRFTQP
jgi:hypothetical protein